MRKKIASNEPSLIKDCLKIDSKEGSISKFFNVNSRSRIVWTSCCNKFVNACSLKDIEEIYSIRAILEGLAIRISLKYLTKKDIKNLDKLKDEMVLAAKNKNIAEMVKKDIEFHKLICYSSKHSRIIKFWSEMSYQIRMFLTTADIVFHNPEQIAERHNEIIKAIKKKDQNKAEKCIKDHINKVGEEIIGILGKKEMTVFLPFSEKKSND